MWSSLRFFEYRELLNVRWSKILETTWSIQSSKKIYNFLISLFYVFETIIKYRTYFENYCKVLQSHTIFSNSNRRFYGKYKTLNFFTIISSYSFEVIIVFNRLFESSCTVLWFHGKDFFVWIWCLIIYAFSSQFFCLFSHYIENIMTNKQTIFKIKIFCGFSIKFKYFLTFRCLHF